MSEQHRNIIRKKFCPKCEHSHFPNTHANAGGICLKGPPQGFLLGMAPKAHPAVVVPDKPADLVPILRAWFPPIGREDTCSQWEQRAEGEA